MPFRSKAQQKWMFAAEDRGELPKGMAKEWADHTKNMKDLPAYAHGKKIYEKASKKRGKK